MSLSDRLLSNKAALLKRTVIILASFSLALYLFMALMAFINGQNRLPFGWKTDVVFSQGTINRKVSSIDPDTVQKEILAGLKKPEAVRFVSFETRIFSRSKAEYLFFLADPHKARIRCNGKPARITIDRYRNKIELNKGWNRIEVRYAPRKRGWPEKFSFYLRFFKETKAAADPMPYYHYVIPGSGLSKHLSNFLKCLNHLKSLGFLIALLLLTAVFLTTIRSRYSVKPADSGGRNLPYIIFEYVMLALTVLFAVVFLNNRLHLSLPHWLIWSVSTAGPAVYIVKSFKGRIRGKITPDKFWALLLVTVLVFGFVYLISGKLFPTEIIGGGDINRHLAMVTHYIEFNSIKTDSLWEIYPQAFHASLAMVSEVFGIPPEKIITLLLALAFILVYFLIYLIIKHFFPETSPFIFLLVAILAHFNFIMRTVFDDYYFPPIVSICFFLVGLFFFYRKRMVPSSLGFAVSLIVYPYFMGLFGMAMLLVFLNRLSTLELTPIRKMIQFCLYFMVPGLFCIIYIYAFGKFNVPQQQQGFFTYFKFNPFSALRSPHSFAILVAISYLLSDSKKNRSILFLTFGTLFGFLGYYVPYYFIDLGSTYYLIKNITYLMLFGIILETPFLHHIIDRVKHLKGKR